MEIRGRALAAEDLLSQEERRRLQVDGRRICWTRGSSSAAATSMTASPGSATCASLIREGSAIGAGGLINRGNDSPTSASATRESVSARPGEANGAKGSGDAKGSGRQALVHVRFPPGALRGREGRLPQSFPSRLRCPLAISKTQRRGVPGSAGRPRGGGRGRGRARGARWPSRRGTRCSCRRAKGEPPETVLCSERAAQRRKPS